MIVRDVDTLRGGERAVSDAGWTSVRMLLARDEMGYSFHITIIRPGTEHEFHYKHHLESVYCISGRGAIEDLTTNERFAIRPGVMYALDQHDRHRIICDAEMVLACVFNPPVTGAEVHRADGSYAPGD